MPHMGFVVCIAVSAFGVTSSMTGNYYWKGETGMMDDSTLWASDSARKVDAGQLPSAADKVNFDWPKYGEFTLGLENTMVVTQATFSGSTYVTLDIGANVFDAGKLVVASATDSTSTTRVDFVSGRILSPQAMMIGNASERGPGYLCMSQGSSVDVESGNITVQYGSILSLDNASLYATNAQTIYFNGASELRVSGTNSLVLSTGTVGFRGGSSIVFCPPRDGASLDHAIVQVQKLSSTEKSGDETVTNAVLRIDSSAARSCAKHGGGTYLLVKGGMTSSKDINANFTVFSTVDAPDFVDVEQDSQGAEIRVIVKPIRGFVIICR